MTTARQPTERRCSLVLTLKYIFICVYWWTRQRIHNTLIVVDLYLRLMGDKTIPDSAEPRLESFYPPFVAGIDLPHQGVVDSYNLDGNDGFNVKLNVTTVIPIDDDTLTWKRFLLYWPFVRGIHQWLVDSPHKAPAVNSSLVSLNNLLNKQWGRQWFKMSWCSCEITMTWKISIDFQLIRPSVAINECPRSTLTWHI